MTIEDRLTALEEAFAEVKKLKGVPGPRGPAGEISAAVRNAQQAVADAESRLHKSTDARLAKFQAEVKQLRADFAAHKESLPETIKNTVDYHTVSVLEDYGVVSDFDGKRITTK
jgi:hypothetical protein